MIPFSENKISGLNAMESKSSEIIPADQSSIIYADLVFDDSSPGRSFKAFCVYEDKNNFSSVLVSRPLNDELKFGGEARSTGCVNNATEKELSDSDRNDDEVDDTDDFSSKKNDGVSPDNLYSKVIKRSTSCVTSNKEIPEKSTKTYCSGMKMLEDNRIVVSTRSGEIMVFDENCKFLFYEEFLHNFEDIVQLSSSELAATHSYCISFYRVNQSDIQEMRDKIIDFEFSSEVTVHGLCHYKGKLMVVCNLPSAFTDRIPHIKVLNMKGKVMSTIKNSKFKIPSSITCTSDGKSIFVCDQGNNSVICFSQDGAIRWEVTQQHRPLDLVLLDESLLVVSFDKSSTLCFSTHGKIKKEIKTDSASSDQPHFLTFQTRRRVLFFCAEETDEHNMQTSVASVRLKIARRRSLSRHFTKKLVIL